MKIKTTLAAAILVLSPTFAMAMGCSGYGHTEQAMSCAEGTAFDEKTGTCIPVVTG
ncbi:hypothetical protein AIOL_002118 [Candidatus Rhodobacter oscarellae]|uniref:Adenylosuccinate lyase n=1 Tax=Candidatus Rhodobacter oscarellae TaxID=1675527 RepID=A0A0J9E396_9RHOB|nr:carbohydrate-binding module family 14 protein [Candidatus Rhodobacter lobularis]KMW57157.1 hypothetical protein AIOL_002118 [Candidatus Rhodobacter lobularis]